MDALEVYRKMFEWNRTEDGVQYEVHLSISNPLHTGRHGFIHARVLPDAKQVCGPKQKCVLKILSCIYENPYEMIFKTT